MRSTKTVLLITTLIVLARLAYIALESSYNSAIVDMVATPLLTSEQATTIEHLGHKLAAVGIALLVVPFLVRLAVKEMVGFRRRVTVGIASGVVFFLAVFVSAYNAQTYLMDTLVESTSAEVRYDAYYSTLFRQLYIDGSIDDPEFEHKPGLGPLMLAMPFAWSAATDLPERLRVSAEDAVLDRARKQAVLELFDSDYQVYRAFQRSTAEHLEKYRVASSNAMAKVSRDQYTVENLYGTTIESLHERYGQYAAVNDRYLKHLEFMRKSGWLRGDIQTLFQASENERDWRHRVLLKKVGLNSESLKVTDWCSDRCPGSVAHLRETITKGLSAQYSETAAGLPMGLSRRSFLVSHDAVNAALMERGVISKPLFSESPVLLSDFQEKSVSLPFGPNVSDQLEGLAGMTGLSMIPAGLSDYEFVNSEPYQRMLVASVGSEIAHLPIDLTKGEFFKVWLEKSSAVLESHKDDLLPASPAQIISEVNESQGLAAVRMLYIPPVAAIVSAVMVILNAVSIIALLVSLSGSRVLAQFASIALVTMILFAGTFFAGMPTELMAESWSIYKSENPANGQLWETFFAVQDVVVSTVKSVGPMPEPQAVERILEVMLGWAI